MINNIITTAHSLQIKGRVLGRCIIIGTDGSPERGRLSSVHAAKESNRRSVIAGRGAAMLLLLARASSTTSPHTFTFSSWSGPTHLEGGCIFHTLRWHVHCSAVQRRACGARGASRAGPRNGWRDALDTKRPRRLSFVLECRGMSDCRPYLRSSTLEYLYSYVFTLRDLSTSYCEELGKKLGTVPT